jgi:hypothetical protein
MSQNRAPCSCDPQVRFAKLSRSEGEESIMPRWTVKEGVALREWLPRCALLAAAMGLLLCGPAFGLDRDRDINEFYHTSWTAKDGAPTDIWDMAQTADGWIWLAAASGLYRFDGVRFERFEPIGEAFRSVSIITLMARPNGELPSSGQLSPTARVRVTTFEDVLLKARLLGGAAQSSAVQAPE